MATGTSVAPSPAKTAWVASMTAATPGVELLVEIAARYAIRTPPEAGFQRRLVVRHRLQARRGVLLDGAGDHAGTRAQSRTVRASGPITSSDHDIGMVPKRLTRPRVGLMPTTPLAAAGQRMEPPVSEPRAA